MLDEAAISQEEIAPEDQETDTGIEDSQEQPTPDDAQTDTAEAPDDAQAADDDPEYEVTVAGEKIKAKLSEILKGYSREADYTRKMQSVSELRKAAEADAAAAKQAKLDYIARLEAFATPKEEAPNWLELAEKDPARYIKEKARWEAKEAQRQEAAQVYQQVIADVQKEAFTELRNSIPEWADANTLKTEVEGMRRVAGDYGFQQEELDAILDPRHFRVLRDAMKYRELQRAKPAIEKRVAQTPKQMGNAASVNSAQASLKGKISAAMERAAKSGSIDDAAAVLRLKRELAATAKR